MERDDILRLAEMLVAFYPRAPTIEIGAAEYRRRFQEDVHNTVRDVGYDSGTRGAVLRLDSERNPFRFE